MRRAMSCVYCPPKSRMPILSTSPPRRSDCGAVSAGTRPTGPPQGNDARLPLAGRAQLLGALEDLPFGLDGRRDDELGLLRLADIQGAVGARARADRADEIQGPVLGEGRAKEDLLERPRHAHADAGAPRQIRMR